MGRRKQLRRPGLLKYKILCVLCVLCAKNILAQSAPSIFLETSTEAVKPGDTWFVTILVDYPQPMEVSAAAPALPAGLKLESSRRQSRYIEAPGGPEDQGYRREGRIWTSIEFRITAEKAGSYTLPPFIVSLPSGIFQTQSCTVQIVSPETKGRQSISLKWQAPGKATVGQPVSLRLIEAAATTEIVANTYIPPPENAILEGNGFNYTLIPLEKGRIRIPAGSFPSRDENLVTIEYPELFIEVE
jgi:hypothetical protein